MATESLILIDEIGSPSRQHVKALTQREHVRMRPSMYIGGKDEAALQSLLPDVFRVFYEEIVAGHCGAVEVVLMPGGWVRVTAHGATLPATPDGVPDLRAALTAFPAPPYRLGLAVVNFLSATAWLEARVGGYRYRQTCREGVPLEDVRRAGITSGLATGITFAFQPDPTIFDTPRMNFQRALHTAWHYAALFPGLRVNMADLRATPPRHETILAPRGVYDYLRRYHLSPAAYRPVYYSAHTEADHGPWEGRVVVGVALAFTQDRDQSVYTLLPSKITQTPGVHGKQLQAMLHMQRGLWPRRDAGYSVVMRVLHPQLALVGGQYDTVSNADLIPLVTDLLAPGALVAVG